MHIYYILPILYTTHWNLFIFFHNLFIETSGIPLLKSCLTITCLMCLYKSQHMAYMSINNLVLMLLITDASDANSSATASINSRCPS